MDNSVNTADRLDEESAADKLAVDTAGEIDAILAVLESKNGKKLPEEALRAAQRCPREITPRLIELIRHSIETVKAGGKRDGDGQFFAFFLLTEFRAKEALPVILEAVSLPGDAPFDLFGDAVTEVLNRTLAALAGDTLEVIDQLICDLDCHRYVRGAAARAYLCLVRDGRMTREEAVSRLGAHLSEANANNDAGGAESLVLALYDYAPHEVRDEIEKSFQLGLVDEWMIGLSDFDECIAEGESFFQAEIGRCSPTGIDDTVAELKLWASFDEEPKAKPPSTFADFAPTIRRPADPGNPRSAPTQPAVVPSPTIRNTERRVGRNEPCPCGSGKKYKKCCARK